jgi:hypothetical protein
MTKNFPEQIFFERVESLETVTFLSFIIPLLFYTLFVLKYLDMSTTNDSNIGFLSPQEDYNRLSRIIICYIK